MRPSIPRSLSRVVAGLAAAAALSALPLSARADDEGDAQSLEKQIREQMDKIMRLMRDNEKALLKAASGGAEKPAAVDVKVPVPPEGSSGAAMEGGDAAMGDGHSAGMDGAEPDQGSQPGASGHEAKKGIDELLDGVRSNGAKIPKELEELIRMIPT